MTDATLAIPVQAVLDGYFAMWNEADPIRRQQIIEQTWTPDASYIEPLMTATGHQGPNDGVAGMQAQFPGQELHPTGHVDSHHDRIRWSWELHGPQSGAPVAGGTNVGVLAADGRLSQVTGFFDFAPDVA